MSLESAREKIKWIKERENSSLYLHDQKLTDSDLIKLMPFIKELNGLTLLDLGGNKLKNVDFLYELNSLTSLDLRYNKLTNADSLKELSNLTYLDLSGNNLLNLDSIKELTSLTKLNLGGNNLTKIDFLKELINLTSLSLSENKLTNTNFLKELSNLTYLDLSENNLSDLDSIKKLTSLTSLNLGGNNFTICNFLENLINLKDLRLYRNNLTDVSVLLRLKRLQLLSLNNNNLPFPREILDDYQNAPKILNYLREYYSQQSQGNLRKLNEAKLVVIGEANVGKTCLINRLLDKQFIKTDSTHGIQISKWKDIELANGEKVQMNVWDFGGQEIMHSTHQFFFSNRTVYVVVVNARENEDTNKTEEWLQRIQSLSKNSPVFIVGNKIDENNRGSDRNNLGYFDIERKRLYAKFPDLIKGIYGVTSDVNQEQYDFLFEEFEAALVAEIGNLKEIHNEFPAKWFEVKDKLEQMKEDKVPFIKYDEYLGYCIKAGMEIVENYRTWIEFLNDIGVALTYSDDKNLGKYLAVLNPQWITRGVYSLIDNAQITINQGILKRDEISQYLNQNEHPADTHDFILNMMRKFKLLIDIERDKTFLIPDLLPKDEPDTGVWKEVLHFQYGYEIYEKSIIRRFMVEMFSLRLNEIYWRNGIVLQRGDNRAFVRADVQDKTISVKIDGNPNTRREFFAIIGRKFDEIHNSFDNLQSILSLGHPKHPNILRPHHRLYLMEKKNPEATEFVEEMFEDFPVKDWLNGFRSEAQRKGEQSKYDFPNAEQVTIIESSSGEVTIKKGNDLQK